MVLSTYTPLFPASLFTPTTCMPRTVTLLADTVIPLPDAGATIVFVVASAPLPEPSMVSDLFTTTFSA